MSQCEPEGWSVGRSVSLVYRSVRACCPQFSAGRPLQRECFSFPSVRGGPGPFRDHVRTDVNSEGRGLPYFFPCRRHAQNEDKGERAFYLRAFVTKVRSNFRRLSVRETSHLRRNVILRCPRQRFVQ